jgi:hypothetical protein
MQEGCGRLVLRISLVGALVVLFGFLIAIVGLVLGPRLGECGPGRPVVVPVPSDCVQAVHFHNQTSSQVEIHPYGRADTEPLRVPPGGGGDLTVLTSGRLSPGFRFLLVWPTVGREYMLEVSDKELDAGNWTIDVTQAVFERSVKASSG